MLLKFELLTARSKLLGSFSTHTMGWGKGGKGFGGGGWVYMPMWGKGGKGKGRSGPNINKYDPSVKVWVGGLPEDKATWKDLQTLCNTVGKTKWIAPLGKRSNGESCVVFSTAE